MSSLRLENEFGRSLARTVTHPTSETMGKIIASSPQIMLRSPAAPSLRTWVTVVGATLGAFMAVLNIQIVNSSLADIQGAIGAGIDDGGWITTSYLISEIIVIPLTGWLARVFSLRTYLLANAVFFLIFSAACASARNLGQMIVLRAFQGFAGGVLIPLAFNIIITVLPKAKQPIGMALFAISATFAPAIGPTIGGYINENYGWQYIFYVNLAPGALMVGMLWASLDRTPTQLGLLKSADWFGIGTMSLGLGSLQTVLEEGNKDDWFGSPFILRLAIVAAISLAAFLWIELKVQKPLLNLRLLWRRNFGFGTLSNFLLGTALYGSVFILPLYLSQVQGYNAEQIGGVLAWVGLPQLVLIPFVPKIMRRLDIRVVIAIGFALFAISNFMSVGLDNDFAGPQFFWPNIVRATGQAVILAPLSAIATGGIEPENVGSASSLFNMMRNLGGAIGIAALQTIITKREQFHSNILIGAVSPFNESTRQRIHHLMACFELHGMSDPSAAAHEAVVAVGRAVRHQATIMGYSDAFFLLGFALVLALVATICLRRGDYSERHGGH